MKPALEALPAGACDCHLHVVGDVDRYPMATDRHYTPGLASHEHLLAHMQRLGLQRAVIVQPSFYGADNRCLLDSLAAMQGAGRGIAVVGPLVSASQLTAMHEAGVRGLRINVESAGVRDIQSVEAPLIYWAKRIEEFGWHLQIYASHHTTSALAPVLASLRVPVVLDHFAMVPILVDSNETSLAQLLRLLEGGNVYVKLSAPYRIAQAEPVVSAVELARRFLRANPERILWGSDWPHTNREEGKASHEVSRYRDFSSESLLDSIERWLPAPELRQLVLVDNPARIYGFPA